jgi:hypothetical protein
MRTKWCGKWLTKSCFILVFGLTRAGGAVAELLNGLMAVEAAKALKPALKLMNFYRLRIDEIKGDAVVTSYTRWLESVQVKGTENQEVYGTGNAFGQRS